MLFNLDKIEFQQIDFNTQSQSLLGDNDFSTIFVDSLKSETGAKVDDITSSASTNTKSKREDDDDEDKVDGKADPEDALEKLKKYLLSKGVDLDSTVVDSEGMDTLKEMLAEAGADKKKLDDFFKSFKEDNGTRAGLSKLLTELEKADITAETTTEKTWLPISHTATLTSILSLLGLDEKSIEAAFDGAKVEGRGIELNKFVENLKSIMSEMGDESNTFSDDQSQELIKSLLTALEGEEVNTGSMSLSRFVNRLESKLSNVNKQDSNQLSTSEVLSKFKNEFLERLNPVGQSEYVKTDLSLIDALIQEGNQKMMEAQGVSVQQTAVEKIADQAQAQVKTDKSSLTEITKEAVRGKESTAAKIKAADASQAKNQTAADQNSAQNSANDNSVRTAKKTTAQGGAQRTLPKYVMNQVGKKLAAAVSNGENQVKINLKPPQLGRIHMSITEAKDGINVSILAEQNSTKDMLNKQSDRLAQSLSEQGIKLGKVDIQLTTNFDQMLANHNKDSQNTKDGKRGKATSRVSGTSTDDEVSINSTILKTVGKKEGSLDLVA